jgi:hypothetical protein
MPRPVDGLAAYLALVGTVSYRTVSQRRASSFRFDLESIWNLGAREMSIRGTMSPTSE